MMLFIVNRPSKEPRFHMQRTDHEGRSQKSAWDAPAQRPRIPPNGPRKTHHHGSRAPHPLTLKPVRSVGAGQRGVTARRAPANGPARGLISSSARTRNSGRPPRSMRRVRTSGCSQTTSHPPSARSVLASPIRSSGPAGIVFAPPARRGMPSTGTGFTLSVAPCWIERHFRRAMKADCLTVHAWMQTE
jgi:hypothetical protein